MTVNSNQSTPILRSTRTLGLRLLLVFCIGIYSLAGAAMSHTVIIHEHAEPHGETPRDRHSQSDDGDNHHNDSHGNDQGEHHHHISCHGSVAMASVHSGEYSHFRQVMEHDILPLNETCPTGPTFEIVKPPQVA